MKKRSVRYSLSLVLAIITLFSLSFTYVVESKDARMDQGMSVSPDQVRIIEGFGFSVRDTQTVETDLVLMPIPDDFFDVPFITITRASGEIEDYSLNDLFPDGVPFTADEWVNTVNAVDAVIIEDTSGYLITSSEKSYHRESYDIALTDSYSREATRIFNWTISAGSIACSSTPLMLNVYDTISYSFTYTANGDSSIGIGLINNATSVIMIIDNHTVTNVGITPVTVSGEWQMAVSGNFSFVIHNRNTYTIYPKGSYTVS